MSHISPIGKMQSPDDILTNEANFSSPKGLGDIESTIESMQDNQTLQKNPGFFYSVFKKIKNILKSFFYLIFFCFKKPSIEQKEYQDLSIKLERAHLLSKELVFEEVNQNPVIYKMLGKHLFTSKSYNPLIFIWRAFVLFKQKTYLEIGKEEAKKDYKLLIPYLEEFYRYKLKRLKDKIDED
ncbi:MAG: hypothetical protein JXA94_03715 [Parachlamydiales bacterium]|nr:hypothetical protein [Parachlamydiales bacterium]